MEQRRPNFNPPHPPEPDAAVSLPEPVRPESVRSQSARSQSARPLASPAAPRSTEPSATVARRRLSVQEQARLRSPPPSEGAQARRRLVLLWTKWLLPIAALVLLGSIAAWPELDRSVRSSRIAYRQIANVDLDSGRMLGARYRGIDGHGRPYMITADEARQVGPDRIDLTRPVADSLTENGSWLLVHARSGVYLPHAQMLDLFDHVVLYRDDGTLIHGPSVTIDVRRGVLASDDWVHAEGPFGVLDAQGDLLSRREGIAQFRGPGRMILNDDHAAAAAPASRGSDAARRSSALPGSAAPRGSTIQ